MAYWSHGVQSIVVAMIVDLIKELGLTQQVIAGLPEGQEARAQAATNEHIVDRLKACLSELKHGQKRQTEEQRKQYILLLAAVMPVRARERDSAGWIRRVCERLDVSRGSRNARQYAAEKAIDLRAGFDQAVENSKRPLQEGDTVMAHGDVCVLKEITISSGHCASERVWMTSRERGRQTRGHQHEFCAKMKFPAQKKIPV